MYSIKQKQLKAFKWHTFFLAIFMGLLAVSCEKSEGLGGDGSITGVIIEQFYNDDFSEVISFAPAVDEEVFILFGSNLVPGDRVVTGTTGEFRFDYLFPGNYSIYYRSQDSSGIYAEEWTTVDVKIGSGERHDLGQLDKKTTIDFDDGAAVISGVVKKTKYDNDSKWPNLVVEYIDWAHEHEVYITYGNHAFYDQRVRTQDNGYFEFKNLIPGDYRIFLYSEDVTKVTEHVVLEYKVSITEADEKIDLGEISIEEI